MNTRIVVTGYGAITPLGSCIESSWERLVKGYSGIRKINKFETDDLPSKIAGNIEWGNKSEGLFCPHDIISEKDQRKVDDFIIYALCAAQEALAKSGWNPKTEQELCRTGVIVGSGIGGLPKIEENVKILEKSGPKRISPFFIPSCLINMASAYISIKFGFKGPNQAPVTACSSGGHAISEAASLIKMGKADVVIAGGAEAAICRLGVSGFSSLRALSTLYNNEPEKASRPWDQDRDGFVIGEGSGIVVLESYEHAKKRNADIHAELLGYGSSGDGYHITSPSIDGDGAIRSMKNALASANLSKDKIDYINAHGTSTPLGDEIELKAIKTVFGNKPSLSISSTKSSIGHLLGGAGGVEAVFSILALKNSLLPPTLNLHNPTPEAANLNLIPLKTQEKEIKYVLSNSFGFGGTNSSLIFAKCQ